MRRLLPQFVIGLLAATALVAPLAHAAPRRLVWSEPIGIDDDQLIALSCPTTHLCVTDDSQHLLTSTDPLGGVSAWRKEPFDGGQQVDSISCPTAALCVATDEFNDVLISSHPAGGATTWHATKLIEGDHDVVGLSCPLTSFCIVDLRGPDRLVSTDVTTASPTWHPMQFPYAFVPGQVVCPSARRCVATDGHRIEVSNGAPEAGSSWSAPVRIFPAGFLPAQSLSCPSLRLCIAVSGGRAAVSTHPFARKPGWRRMRIDPGAAFGSLEDVACPTVTFCAAVAQPNRELESTNPAGGPSAWTPWRIFDPFGYETGLACPSARVCLEVDDDRNVTIGTVTDPKAMTLAARLAGRKIATHVRLSARAKGEITVTYTAYQVQYVQGERVLTPRGHRARTVLVHSGRANATLAPERAALSVATFIRVTARYGGDAHHPPNTVVRIIQLRKT